MIHDFDMAVFPAGDMPESVMATGSVLTDKAIEPLGDYDSFGGSALGRRPAAL